MIIWDELKLSEVTSYIKRGVSPKYVEKDGFPIINQKCIRENKVSYEHSKLISKLQNVNKDKFLQDGDVLVNSTGTGTLGRVAQYKKIGENIFCDTHVSIVRANDKIDKDFLAYQLSYKEPMIENYGKGATNQIELGTADLGLLKIQLPPLPTQKKIAKILSNYDDLIENNLKRIKLLEESARLAYEEWFLRFRIDGEKLEIDSETGLPFGWKEKEITSIATINKKSITVRTAPEHIKYIDISSTDTGYHKSPEIMNFKDAPSRARRIVEYGDTIFSTVRPNRKTYSLILENDPILIVSTGFAVVSPTVNETFPFIYFTLSSQNFIDSAVAVAGGAAYPAINQTDFEKLKIVIPTKDILDNFSRLTSPILKNKSNFLNQNQLLKEARDILLPRLMTGMIDVDELEVAYELRHPQTQNVRWHKISNKNLCYTYLL